MDEPGGPERIARTDAEVCADVEDKVYLQESSQDDQSLEEENELPTHSNPARIAPRVFMRIKSARVAVEKELDMSTELDQGGLPALECVDYSMPQYRQVVRLHSTFVVKRKTSLLFKATMCTMGDLWQPDAPLDYAAPTVMRCPPKVLLSLAISFGFSAGVVGISSAFIQSTMVGKRSDCGNTPAVYTDTLDGEDAAG